MWGLDFSKLPNWGAGIQQMAMGGEIFKNLKSGAPLLFDTKE